MSTRPRNRRKDRKSRHASTPGAQLAETSPGEGGETPAPIPSADDRRIAAEAAALEASVLVSESESLDRCDSAASTAAGGDSPVPASAEGLDALPSVIVPSALLVPVEDVEPVAPAAREVDATRRGQWPIVAPSPSAAVPPREGRAALAAARIMPTRRDVVPVDPPAVAVAPAPPPVVVQRPEGGGFVASLGIVLLAAAGIYLIAQAGDGRPSRESRADGPDEATERALASSPTDDAAIHPPIAPPAPSPPAPSSGRELARAPARASSPGSPATAARVTSPAQVKSPGLASLPQAEAAASSTGAQRDTERGPDRVAMAGEGTAPAGPEIASNAPGAAPFASPRQEEKAEGTAGPSGEVAARPGPEVASPMRPASPPADARVLAGTRPRPVGTAAAWDHVPPLVDGRRAPSPHGLRPASPRVKPGDGDERLARWETVPPRAASEAPRRGGEGEARTD